MESPDPVNRKRLDRWIFSVSTDGFEFFTEEQLFDHYVGLLAHVFPSKEEARNKIYLVSCGRRFGFGAQIDANSADRIKGGSAILFKAEDHYYDARNKDPSGNVFPLDYMSLDMPVETCKSGNPNEIGAKNKVYAIWWKIPFGFCAEIDEDSSVKLKALQDVLVVLPDYSFDAKSKSPGHEGKSLNTINYLASILIVFFHLPWVFIFDVDVLSSPPKHEYIVVVVDQKQIYNDLTDQHHVDGIGRRISSFIPTGSQKCPLCSTSTHWEIFSLYGYIYDDRDDFSDDEDLDRMDEFEFVEHAGSVAKITRFNTVLMISTATIICWIVHLKHPGCEFANALDVFHYCVQLLAKAVGRCSSTALQDVLVVLPDYSFDANKKKNTGGKGKSVNTIKYLSFILFYFSIFLRYIQVDRDNYDDEDLDHMEEPVGEFNFVSRLVWIKNKPQL
ncbi:hypothetical protein IFM89_010957 [Coptis chinensis]|uniref:MORF/ORRM1/DAG-like MORF domain-containing protein n=1 Tax=Coptis chinensis TaxID=261450 RepID=A0A835IQ15_9MAGN|nr:hypothetical protein IFM89_010957 [Coptis chinensis]